MCHEDEFKPIINVYKQLRQDGVIFPMREANNQFLINFDGKKSPIFETIEDGFIYEEPTKKLSRKKYAIANIEPETKFNAHDNYVPPQQQQQQVQRILIREYTQEGWL